MIATNFIRHPEALLAQLELELVFAVPEVVREADLAAMRASFSAAGAWLRQYASAAVRMAKAVPAWYAAMRRRAAALAKAVKAAIRSIFEQE